MTSRAVLAAVATVLLWAGACNKPDDNRCANFSADNGQFEACAWTLDQADALCESKGYKHFWGKVTDTSGCDGLGDTTRYIRALTCCTQ